MDEHARRALRFMASGHCPGAIDYIRVPVQVDHMTSTTMGFKTGDLARIAFKRVEELEKKTDEMAELIADLTRALVNLPLVDSPTVPPLLSKASKMLRDHYRESDRG